MSMVNPVTCLFSPFEVLNAAFEVHFFLWASFLHLIKTLIACRNTQTRLSKVDTLLNNAFKWTPITVSHGEVHISEKGIL